MVKKQNDIDVLYVPRKRKVPTHFDEGNAVPSFHNSVKEYYCQIYFETLDRITSCVKERFNQIGNVFVGVAEFSSLLQSSIRRI